MAFFSSEGDDDGGGSLWSQVSLFNTSNPVQDILEKDEFTLSELLEEDELLQEVKAQNKKLIDFLALESSVAEMLDFITTAAPEGASDMRVHKYPYVSCEIVCCDVPEVLDTLVEGRDGALLASLFRILGWEGGEGAGAAGGQEAGPLDPRLAGYFEKVFALLHQRKGLELVTFLNGGGIALFGRFAACLESYSVMEAVRRMLQPALLDSYDDQGGSFGDDGGFGFGGGGAGSGDEGSGADSFPTVCWQGDARVVGMLLEVLGAQGEDGDGSMTSAREHVAELLLLVVYNNSVTDGGGGMGGIDESFGDAGADGGGPKRTSPLLAAIASRDAAERIVRLALPDGKEGGAEMYSASSAMSSALAVLETLVSCCPMAVGSAAAGGAEGEEEKADEKGEGAVAAAAAAAAGEDAKDDGVITATVLDGDGGGGGAEEDAGPAPTAPVFDVIAERVGLIAQWLKGDVGAPRTMRHQDARETTTPCLGIGRLRVVELVVVLVQCRHAGVEAALVEHGVLPLCLDLFFAFPWSNMLHSLVEHVAIAVVEGGSEPLQLCLLRDGNLIARVVEAYAADEEQRKGAKKGRLGYMGHINRISNLVLASIEASERDIESSANNSGGLDESGAGSALDDSSMGFTGASVAAARFARLVQESEDKEQWNNFVESTLKEINCLENVPLGADGGGADDSVELPSGGAGGDDDGGSGSVFNLDALGRQLDSAGGGEGDGDDFAPRTFASNLSDDDSDHSSASEHSSDEEGQSFDSDVVATAAGPAGSADSDDAEWAAFDKPADAGDAAGGDFTNFGDVQAAGSGSGDAAADGGFAFVEAGESGEGSDAGAEPPFDPFANFGAPAETPAAPPTGADSGGEAFDAFANFGS